MIEQRYASLRREYWPMQIDVWVTWFALIDVWPLR